MGLLDVEEVDVERGDGPRPVQGRGPRAPCDPSHGPENVTIGTSSKEWKNGRPASAASFPGRGPFEYDDSG